MWGWFHGGSVRNFARSVWSWLARFFFDDHRHAVGGMTYSIGQPMNRPFDGKK
jgi:hypothetical protein